MYDKCSLPSKYRASNHKLMRLSKETGSQYLEPIDGAAIDEGWEFAQPVAESISNVAHREHNVQLITTALHKKVEERSWCAVGLLGLIALPVKLSHFLTDLLLLIKWVEVGNLTSIQQVVNVLEERFLLDLESKLIVMTVC